MSKVYILHLKPVFYLHLKLVNVGVLIRFHEKIKVFKLYLTGRLAWEVGGNGEAKSRVD